LNNIITRDPDVLHFLNENNYADAAKVLLQEQKRNWEMLAEGYRSLKQIQVKSFRFDSLTIKVQYNPKRITSSSAKVDPDSIKRRQCFLCPENLPPEQKGIIYKNEYLILCNPFPIFPEHFTISNIKHIPQEIQNSFASLLLLAKDLSKYYTVFYNGPRCGASAPDHLHFQAGIKGFMSIESEYSQMKINYGKVLFKDTVLSVYAVRDGLRKFLFVESGNFEKLQDAFNNFYSAYSEISGNQEEPMMNILVYYENTWKIFIFLREKHRPSFFYREGDEKILWSPAAVDLGGVIITPLENDYYKISEKIISEGFNEITISEEKFSFIEKRMRENFK
jgi:hypothetical protein